MISHLNKKNKPKVIDINSKKITKRSAVARGIVMFSKTSLKKLNH